MTRRLGEMLERFQAIGFWHRIAPRLSITTERPLEIDERDTLWPASLDQDVEHLQRQGYCLISSVIPEATLHTLRSAVERLQAEGIPPVFLFVYDEPWTLLMSLRRVLARVLGGEFLVLPSVYAWFVDAAHQTAFPPHRDLARLTDLEQPDGRPNYVTLWTPLTEVTTANSCIHLVPKDLDPHYPDNLSNQTISDPRTVRPVPAAPGSLIFWNLGVLHWGSRAKPGQTPRISLGYYLQRADRSPVNHPIVDLTRPLGFEFRLALIGKQLLSYYRLGDPDVLSLGHQLEALHLDTRRTRLMKEMWLARPGAGETSPARAGSTRP